MTDRRTSTEETPEPNEEGTGTMRRTPAGIRERVEPDPVDVVLGQGLTRHDPVGDDVADSDDTGGVVGVTAQRQGGPASVTPEGADDTTTPPQRQSDTATGVSDTRTRRQTPPTKEATRTDDATGDDTAGAAVPAQGEDSDMTPTTTAGASVRARKETSAGGRSGKGHAATVEEPPIEAMKSASFSLPPSLIARVRAAQWHTQVRPDGHHNVSEMVRKTLIAEVERLEQKYNRGRPFAVVDKLRTGPSPQGAKRGRAALVQGAAEEGRSGRR